MGEREAAGDKGRLSVISDVVIGVVLVLLADNLRRGIGPEPAWQAAWPHLLAFAIGTFTLAVVWVNHSLLTRALDRADRLVLWLNLHVLLWIALFPLSIGLLGAGRLSRSSVIVHGVVLTGMSVAILVLRGYLRAARADNRELAALSQVASYRSAAAMLICLGSIPMAFVSLPLALACFFAAPLLFLLPESRDG